MKKINKKSSMILYAFAGMGVNMLNLMMGSYLCSAIIADGFTKEAAVFQTFEQRNIVIVSLWAIFGAVAKVLDGIIDIPMAAFADNLKSKFGRRRPALVIGMIPMIISYVLFMFVPNPTGATILNTVYLGIMLCVFYSFYTLTMVTYYATYTEIVDNTEDRNFISNAKSVFDIVYFILGYVLIRAFLESVNIRTVALCVLPIVLTMVIPLFMIKEGDNRGSETVAYEKVSLVKSLKHTLKNKTFILWMITYAFMTFGVQLFLSGINEYFADTGLNMIYVMMGSFAPVPLTLWLYNKIIVKKGFAFAFRYALITYSIGMLALFGVSFMGDGVFRIICAIISGIICSLAIGALFSVAYSIPSQLAADEEKEKGTKNSAMYFAVQGLFSGVATAIGSYVVLNILKDITGEIDNPLVVNPMYFLTVVCALGTLIAFATTYVLPNSLKILGKSGDKK